MDLFGSLKLKRLGSIALLLTVVLLFSSCWHQGWVRQSEYKGNALPFYISDNNRFFQDKTGKPFFWLADTGWRTFAGPTKEQVTEYFKIRKNQGFNTIQIFYTMSWAPVNAENDSAFVHNDPLQLNENYVAFAKWCAQEAKRQELILCIILGEVFRNDTRFKRIDDEEAAYRYAHQLVSRFRDDDNIVWALAQDFQGVRNSLWSALAEGIHDAIDGVNNRDGRANWNNAMVTYHIGWEQSSSLYVHNEPWLDFNMIQSSHCRRDNHHVYTLAWMDWEKTPAKPFFDAEPNYEKHPIWLWGDGKSFDDYDVRKASYRSVFAGGCGITYGADRVWQLDDDWMDCLHYPGALQLIHLKNLMLSRPYFERAPDREFIRSVNPNKAEKIIATSSTKGNYAMVYVPFSGQSFTIDASKLKGKKLKAWWFSPLDGKTYHANGQIASEPFGVEKSDKMNIISPKLEKSVDWVLVIDSESSAYSIPGHPIY